ncbi:MAG TPA: prepilin peptidase [Pseudoneobacillus sp.]|nr:prepilin peptidase [Pseudoneobacillus sp.]
MWTNILLILLLIICVITDLKERKIYNKILLPIFLIAITYSFISSGWSGLITSILASFVGLSILLIPYLMGGMGAGDVKLLAVIGALKGIGFVLMTSLYMALIGGIIGLFILLFHKGLVARIKQIFYFFTIRPQGVKIPILLDKEALSTTYPYGVAIALGAVGAIFEATGGLF